MHRGETHHLSAVGLCCTYFPIASCHCCNKLAGMTDKEGGGGGSAGVGGQDEGGGGVLGQGPQLGKGFGSGARVGCGVGWGGVGGQGGGVGRGDQPFERPWAVLHMLSHLILPLLQQVGRHDNEGGLDRHRLPLPLVLLLPLQVLNRPGRRRGVGQDEHEAL